MKKSLPSAILVDLDDTVITFTAPRMETWNQAVEESVFGFQDMNSNAIFSAIQRREEWMWEDEERHRIWRMDLVKARREIVRLAFEDLNLKNHFLADAIADHYSSVRNRSLSLIPGAKDTVLRLKELGMKLALITNGSSETQNEKIKRFDLSRFFDKILIEGEVGFGKPNERIYRIALQTLDVDPEDAWMIGDNLLWDVIAPQRIGVNGIWVNPRGRKNTYDMEPFLTIQSLDQVIPFINRLSIGSC